MQQQSLFSHELSYRENINIHVFKTLLFEENA